MRAIIIAGLLLAPGLAQAQAIVTKVVQPFVPQFAFQNGTMVASGQIDANALIGHPVLEQRPADMLLKVMTDRGPVFVKMSAVSTTGTLPPPPRRGCVQIGPQSAETDRSLGQRDFA